MSLISERETHILYRFTTQSEIFQAFISWNVDDYGLQIMKTQNSVSQKISILHKINKKGHFKQKCHFPEDVWAWWLLMHWLQLQFTPCEALPSVWIGFAGQYSQACGHPCCLCTFSYPISSFQSTLHLICFDTALLEQSPLSVMTLCDLLSLWRVSMIVFWTIGSQQCSPLLCFQRTRDTRNWYCMDCSLLKLKCKYSNILSNISDFWLSWAVSSNHHIFF